MVEQHASNFVLPAIVRLVDVDVEHLPADNVAEQQLVLKFRDHVSPVDDYTGDGDRSFQQRVLLVELDNRIRDIGIAAWIVEIDRIVTRDYRLWVSLEASLPTVPAKVGPHRDNADLLHHV